MKFNILPIPKIDKDIPKCNINGMQDKFRRAALDLISEINMALKKVKVTNKDTNPEIYYLYDKDSMRTFMGRLTENDEIIMHGEGQPFILGLQEPSAYDLHAQLFAKLLYENKMPSFPLNITLLTCQSATTYAPVDSNIDINFARDMSRALYAFGYKNVKVAGFTGFVVVKPNGGKYSISSTLGYSNKGTHCNLERAKRVYKNGELLTPNAKIMTNNLSNMAFIWADKYIKNAIAGQKETIAREQLINPSTLQSSHSFFCASDRNELIEACDHKNTH